MSKFSKPHACISHAVKQRLKDQYIKIWSSDVNDSAKGQICKFFKHSFGLIKYIHNLPTKLRNCSSAVFSMHCKMNIVSYVDTYRGNTEIWGP